MAKPVVETRHGRIGGELEGGVYVFRGVPYAAPPVGELRFRPPKPPPPWRRIREAERFGSIAPQDKSELALMAPRDAESWSEDCLTLNLWTSGLDRPRRPVLVWIHGGGFRSGTGSSAMYDGANLARRGDVVVITFNYRLGALGFLCHPDLRDPETGASGNWGLLDQLEVLEWVADHVAAFGGDPLNVTIFGESAGAASVATLMGTPSAQGLFQRAIVQSGHPVATPAEVGIRAAENLLKELGLQPRDFEALRKLPAEAILEAQTRCAPPVHGGIRLPFSPVIDGGLLRCSPLDEIRGGLSRGVPLLVGTNREEWKLFALGDPRRGSLDGDALCKRLERLLPGEHPCGTPHALRAIEAYRSSRSARNESADPWDLWSAIQTDRLFRAPALNFASLHAGHEKTTFVYRFDWSSPSAALGACHGLEIPFVFGTLDQPGVAGFAGADKHAKKLANRMQRAWIRFAHDGDPSHDDLPDWRAYESARRETMLFGREPRAEHAPDEPERVFWDALA